MPHYYDHKDYINERKMKYWSQPGLKAEQRRINFDIRLEHYAKKQNKKRFVKMLEGWAESFKFPCPGVPTMTMMRYAKLAREHFYRACEDRTLGRVVNNMVAAYLRIANGVTKEII